jgi:hypothetical protein
LVASTDDLDSCAVVAWAALVEMRELVPVPDWTESIPAMSATDKSTATTAEVPREI